MDPENPTPASYEQIVDAMRWVCSESVRREKRLQKRIKYLEDALATALATKLPAAPIIAYRIVPAQSPTIPIEQWRAECLGISGKTKDLAQRVAAILGKTCVYLVDKHAIVIFDVQMDYGQIASSVFANNAMPIFKMMVDPQDVNSGEMAGEARALLLKWLGPAYGKWYVYSQGIAVLDGPVAEELRKKLGLGAGKQRPCIVLPRSTDPCKISELLGYANQAVRRTENPS